MKLNSTIDSKLDILETKARPRHLDFETEAGETFQKSNSRLSWGETAVSRTTSLTFSPQIIRFQQYYYNMPWTLNLLLLLKSQLVTGDESSWPYDELTGYPRLGRAAAVDEPLSAEGTDERAVVDDPSPSVDGVVIDVPMRTSCISVDWRSTAILTGSVAVWPSWRVVAAAIKCTADLRLFNSVLSWTTWRTSIRSATISCRILLISTCSIPTGGSRAKLKA